MTDNCVSMYENAPPNKLGEWEDHDCATPLAYICKGPVSDKVSCTHPNQDFRKKVISVVLQHCMRTINYSMKINCN